MTTPTPPPVAGLPEGVELVRIGTPEDNEFEIISVSYVDGKPVVQLHQGKRLGLAAAVVVKPANGYKFLYDIRTLGYDVVKTFPPVTKQVTLKYVVDNDRDQGDFEALLDHAKRMPGFISLE